MQAADFFADSSALQAVCSELATRLESQPATEQTPPPNSMKHEQQTHTEATNVTETDTGTNSLADKVCCFLTGISLHLVFWTTIVFENC